MLVKVDPISANSNALLVWSESSMTSTQLYTPGKDSRRDAAPETDVLYVVSNTDKARHVTVRRGTHSAGAVVADIHYPSEWQRRKNGSVQFAGAAGKPVKFADWMTNFGKKGKEHRVVIAGDGYTWVERRTSRTSVVYSLMKGTTTIATFVPSMINRPAGSVDRIATRSHLEFSGPQLPDEQLTDGIVVSILAIQHMVMLSGNSGSVVWLPLDASLLLCAC